MCSNLLLLPSHQDLLNRITGCHRTTTAETIHAQAAYAQAAHAQAANAQATHAQAADAQAAHAQAVDAQAAHAQEAYAQATLGPRGAWMGSGTPHPDAPHLNTPLPLSMVLC